MPKCGKPNLCSIASKLGTIWSIFYMPFLCYAVQWVVSEKIHIPPTEHRTDIPWRFNTFLRPPRLWMVEISFLGGKWIFPRMTK